MKYTLLENGIDSLKATHINIEKMKELQEGIDHCVKDSILSLNHAIEILLKLILKNYNEYLVFSNLDNYMAAKEKMMQQGKNNVFEVSPNLKTITLNECINRVQYLCDIPISEDYKTVIAFMNKKRNEITHYEIDLSTKELAELIEKLVTCFELSIKFFKVHIPDIEALLEDARFEMTSEDYEEAMADMYADMAYEQDREDRLMYG